MRLHMGRLWNNLIAMRFPMLVVRISPILPLLLMPLARPIFSQSKKSECGKPPRIVFHPNMSEEDVASVKSSSLKGKVAVTVNEDGDVTEAKVLAATPKEGAQFLSKAVMLTKFEPRPGCGPLKIEFTFNLSNK
jgi:hypothetical protein